MGGLKIIKNRLPFPSIRPYKGERGSLFRALESGRGVGGCKIESEFVSYIAVSRRPPLHVFFAVAKIHVVCSDSYSGG